MGAQIVLVSPRDQKEAYVIRSTEYGMLPTIIRSTQFSLVSNMACTSIRLINRH